MLNTARVLNSAWPSGNVLLVGEAVEHTEHGTASLHVNIIVVHSIRLGVSMRVHV